MVSEFVSEDHDPLLRAAVGCLSHGQGQRVRPGTKPQHTGAVRPHTPHTRNRADSKAWRTDDESQRRTTRIKITGSEFSMKFNENGTSPMNPPYQKSFIVSHHVHCYVTGMPCLN